MRNKFPLAKILILVTILAVPGFLYYLLQEKGQNRYKPLPIYGPKSLAGTFHIKRGDSIPDTVYHTVPDFKAINQNAKVFNFDTSPKKLSIVNFFYSNCKTGCPEVFKNIQWLFNEYQDNKIIRFISITVDPDHDTVPVLVDYAKEYSLAADKWMFLTADTNLIYPLARDQFFANAFKAEGEQGFIHSNKLILLDANNRIRGYYEGTSIQEVKKLNDEIKVLITEELRKIKAEF